MGLKHIKVLEEDCSGCFAEPSVSRNAVNEKILWLQFPVYDLKSQSVLAAKCGIIQSQTGLDGRNSVCLNTELPNHLAKKSIQFSKQRVRVPNSSFAG